MAQQDLWVDILLNRTFRGSDYVSVFMFITYCFFGSSIPCMIWNRNKTPVEKDHSTKKGFIQYSEPVKKKFRVLLEPIIV